jgi:hypothetical protein
MVINHTVRAIAEIGLGLVFVVGAIFNSLYTFKHGEEFYGSFADSAWFPPAGTLMRRIVIPNASLFTIILVLIQLSVATLILTRGNFVSIGLIEGGMFSLIAALVSSKGGAIANLALAALLGFLACGP